MSERRQPYQVLLNVIAVPILIVLALVTFAALAVAIHATTAGAPEKLVGWGLMLAALAGIAYFGRKRR